MPDIDVSHVFCHLGVFLWILAVEVNMKHGPHMLVVTNLTVHTNLSILCEIVLYKFVKTLMEWTVRKLIIYQIVRVQIIIILLLFVDSLPDKDTSCILMHEFIDFCCDLEAGCCCIRLTLMPPLRLKNIQFVSLFEPGGMWSREQYWALATQQVIILNVLG